MVPASRGWCKVLLGLMLVSFGTTIELYDELPPTDDVIYQDDKDIDTGPPVLGKRLAVPLVGAGARDVMLYKILDALQRQEHALFRPAYRPNSIPRIEEERRAMSDVLAPQVSAFKRFSNPGAMQLGVKVEPARLHQKWKSKKGKAIGSQMVCYFKLCAFRSPA